MRSLQKAQPKLPTAASLATVQAAAEAARQPLERKQARAADTMAEQQGAASTNPPEPGQVTAQTVGQPSLPAQSNADSARAAQHNGPAEVPEPTLRDASNNAELNGQFAEPPSEAVRMDLDFNAVTLDSVAAVQQSAGETLEVSKDANNMQMRAQVLAVPSSLELCRQDIRAFHSSLAPDAFEEIKGSSARQSQWQMLLTNANRPQVLLMPMHTCVTRP